MSPVIHKSFATKVVEVVPIVIEPMIPPIVEDYLEENPPAGATWGNIAGTLSNQTDLNNALAGKETANSNIQAHVGSAHAPSNAQKNSDILKSEIEAVLTGELTSHSHAGGGGGLSQQQIEGLL